MKFCAESETVSLTVELDGKFDFASYKESCQESGIKYVQLGKCFVTKRGKILIHIYDNGTCMFLNCSSVEEAKEFAKAFFIELSYI